MHKLKNAIRIIVVMDAKKLFPLNTGVSQIRGIIAIIKDNKGAIDVSKLAEETNDEIDDLFPLIDTCVLLKLCTVKEGVVKLTKSGRNIATNNTREVMAKSLKKVEPFSSALKEIEKAKRIDTADLSKALYTKGVMYNTDEITNIELLKNLLLKWGVRSKIFSYDNGSDTWFR
ncbi:MAG: AAA-associated domain-containing protein [Candidatus Micrarchaeaceae archaeon]